MRQFKFFERNTISEQMTPIMCVDSEQIFYIPTIMYGNIRRAGVRHFENGINALVRTFVVPSEGNGHHRESYTYRIDNTYRLMTQFETIVIEYSIKFLEVEGYLRFRTNARLG